MNDQRDWYVGRFDIVNSDEREMPHLDRRSKDFNSQFIFNKKNRIFGSISFLSKTIRIRIEIAIEFFYSKFEK